MGVVWVVTYAVPEGKTGQQVVDQLQSRVEQMGATKSGNYSVDCEMHQSKQTTPMRTVHILHNSEQPATCFAILDNNTCLVSDTLFDLLMLKLKDFYIWRKHSKVETKGLRYELGDFIIKVGSVIMGGSIFKGILVEVEYVPCVVAGECWALMTEFMQGFMGEGIEPTAHLKTRTSELYEPADTMKQYLEHYQNIRRASAIQQQQTQQMQQQQTQQQMQHHHQQQQQQQHMVAQQHSQQQPPLQQQQHSQQPQIPQPMNVLGMHR